MPSYFDIVVYALSTKSGRFALLIFINLWLFILLSSYSSFRTCFSHFITAFKPSYSRCTFIFNDSISTNFSSLFIGGWSCTSSPSIVIIILFFFQILFFLFELVKGLEICLQAFWTWAIGLSNSFQRSVEHLAWTVSIVRLFLTDFDLFGCLLALHAVRK